MTIYWTIVLIDTFAMAESMIASQEELALMRFNPKRLTRIRAARLKRERLERVGDAA